VIYPVRTNAEFVPYDIPVEQREILGDEQYTDLELNKTFIKYNYVGNLVPQIQKEKIIAANTEKEGQTYKIYSGNQFIFINNDWSYLEYATTTIEEFNILTTDKVGLLNWINPFSAQIVNADTIYANASDGYIRKGDSTDWDTTHDAVTGSVVVTNITAGYFAGVDNRTGNIELDRGTLYFDTSSISGTVTNADLCLTPNEINNDDNDGKNYISIVSNDSVDADNPATTDFDAIGDAIDNPTKLSDDISLNSMSVGSASCFTLDANGIAEIGASTALGVREGHDIEDELVVSSGRSGLQIRYSEETGTTDDPYLEITLAEEEEEETATTTAMEVGSVPIFNDISVISGYTEIYTDSTSTPSETRYHVFHIPFFVWFIFWLVFSTFFARILIEIIIRLRKS